MILGVSYKHLALVLGVSMAVVYASNRRLPVLGNAVRTLIG